MVCNFYLFFMLTKYRIFLQPSNEKVFLIKSQNDPIHIKI